MGNRAQFFDVTILGCGSSGGVPRIGNNWGECDPTNSKNRRQRCSILIEASYDGAPGTTNIVIDTGCDFRAQMLDAGISHLDGVIYTHEHADHTHGIDDLRVLALSSGNRIETYMSAETAERLMSAFSYCFVSAKGSDYPPILTANQIEPDGQFTIDGPGGRVDITTFLQEHGSIHSLGIKIGSMAYSCDLSALPQRSRAAMDGVSLWIVDALRRKPHPSHLCLDESVALIGEIGVDEALLTNMHIDLDYDTLCTELPEHIRPAYDGLKVSMLLD